MIEVSHLTKSFGRRTVVDDLSFRVLPGVVTGLLGPSGSGVTTTLRLILGLERPSSGSALINGRQFSDLERPADTVGAMMDGHRLNGIGRSHHRRWLTPAGHRRRTAVVTVVQSDPDHYILDQPFNGLDAEDARWMRQLLRGLAARGKTVLVAGHSLTEMAHVADHLVVIGNGKLVADCTVDEFLVRSGRRAVRVRAERQTELYDLLTGMGATVTPRISENGVALLVRGLSVDGVAEAAVNFGMLELAEEEVASERALLEVTGMGVPTVGTLARGGLG
ncbi:ATP-binding cassette domain-containing protein [Tessaracoccus sp. G1721]